MGTHESPQEFPVRHQRRPWWPLGAAALAAVAAGVFLWRWPWLPPAGEAISDRHKPVDVAASPLVPENPSVGATSSRPDTPSAVDTTPRKPIFTEPTSPPTVSTDLLEEADRAMTRLVEDFPNLIESLEQRAEFLKWRGETGRAVKDWEQCLKLDPHYAQAYLGLARIAESQGDYDQSAKLYRQAFAHDPELFYAKTELARVLIKLGQAADAITMLEKESGAAQSAECHFMLAQAYVQQQEYEKACQHYEIATRLQPDHVDAHHGWAMALARLGRRDEAQEKMARFQKLRGGRLEVIRTQRLEFDDLTAVCGDVAVMYANNAKIYLTRGQPAAAEELWSRAAQIAPRNVECRQGLAFLYRRSGRTKDAIAMLGELAEIAPKPFPYQIEIGRLCAEVGDFNAAEKAFQKACESDPEAGAGYAELAQFYLRSDRKLDEAAELVEKALQRSNAAEIYHLAAAIREKRGDLTGARQALEQAMQRDPNNPLFSQQLQRLRGVKTPPRGSR